MIVTDLGGTWVRAGLIGEAPSIVRRTPKSRGALLEMLAEIVASHCGERVIGVACPGIVDRHGFVRVSFLPQLDQLDLACELREAGALTAVVLNDVDAQALGSVRADELLAVIGCGTRIGGSVISHVDPELNRERYQGEFGHVPCGSRSNAVCECGARDCLDLAIAGFRLEARYGSWWNDESKRAEVTLVVADALSEAVRSIQVCVGPDRVLITGRLTDHQDVRARVLANVSSTIWTETAIEFLPNTWSAVGRGLSRVFEDQTQSER